jgi:hypothetical protein
MAHLWAADNREWVVVPLSTHRPPDLARLFGRLTRASAAPWHADARAETPVLVPSCTDGSKTRDSWILLASPSAPVRVNGASLPWGIRVLQDRDEIAVEDHPPLYFSVESVAQVEPLPEMGLRVACPRCRGEVKPGSATVRCPAPRCGVWYHESIDGGFMSWTWRWRVNAAPYCHPGRTLSGSGA